MKNIMDIGKVRELKRRFVDEYTTPLEDLGYSMAIGLGAQGEDYSLEVRLQPLEDSFDPIPENLFDQIKDDVLPSKYSGLDVNVQYIGQIRPR